MALIRTAGKIFSEINKSQLQLASSRCLSEDRNTSFGSRSLSEERNISFGSFRAIPEWNVNHTRKFSTKSRPRAKSWISGCLSPKNTKDPKVVPHKVGPKVDKPSWIDFFVAKVTGSGSSGSQNSPAPNPVRCGEQERLNKEMIAAAKEAVKVAEKCMTFPGRPVVVERQPRPPPQHKVPNSLQQITKDPQYVMPCAPCTPSSVKCTGVLEMAKKLPYSEMRPNSPTRKPACRAKELPNVVKVGCSLKSRLSSEILCHARRSRKNQVMEDSKKSLHTAFERVASRSHFDKVSDYDMQQMLPDTNYNTTALLGLQRSERDWAGTSPSYNRVISSNQQRSFSNRSQSLPNFGKRNKAEEMAPTRRQAEKKASTDNTVTVNSPAGVKKTPLIEYINSKSNNLAIKPEVIKNIFQRSEVGKVSAGSMSKGVERQIKTMETYQGLNRRNTAVRSVPVSENARKMEIEISPKPYKGDPISRHAIDEKTVAFNCHSKNKIEAIKRSTDRDNETKIWQIQALKTQALAGRPKTSPPEMRFDSKIKAGLGKLLGFKMGSSTDNKTNETLPGKTGRKSAKQRNVETKMLQKKIEPLPKKLPFKIVNYSSTAIAPKKSISLQSLTDRPAKVRDMINKKFIHNNFSYEKTGNFHQSRTEETNLSESKNQDAFPTNVDSVAPLKPIDSIKKNHFKVFKGILTGERNAGPLKAVANTADAPKKVALEKHEPADNVAPKDMLSSYAPPMEKMRLIERREPELTEAQKNMILKIQKKIQYMHLTHINTNIEPQDGKVVLVDGAHIVHLGRNIARHFSSVADSQPPPPPPRPNVRIEANNSPPPSRSSELLASNSQSNATLKRSYSDSAFRRLDLGKGEFEKRCYSKAPDDDHSPSSVIRRAPPMPSFSDYMAARKNKLGSVNGVTYLKNATAASTLPVSSKMMTSGTLTQNKELGAWYFNVKKLEKGGSIERYRTIDRTTTSPVDENRELTVECSLPPRRREEIKWPLDPNFEQSAVSKERVTQITEKYIDSANSVRKYAQFVSKKPQTFTYLPKSTKALEQTVTHAQINYKNKVAFKLIEEQKPGELPKKVDPISLDPASYKQVEVTPKMKREKGDLKNDFDDSIFDLPEISMPRKKCGPSLIRENKIIENDKKQCMWNPFAKKDSPQSNVNKGKLDKTKDDTIKNKNLNVSKPDSLMNRGDPCAKKIETKKKDDPCQKKEDPRKKKEDPCKKKEDPCKKKEDPCKKKEDPCKKKEDPCKKKEDPCKKKEDPCKKKEDPCKKKEDPCKKKEDPCKKKEDPCKKKEDPCKKKEDPCLKKEDPCKKKEDPCKKKEDPCKKKEDPCQKKEDPCKKKEDPCKKKEDPCKKKEDPCKKKEDPCQKKEDPCKKKEDPCKKKEDPCKKKEDPCQKKEDPCKKKEDPCKKKEDPCKKKEDPCKMRDDPCKKREDPWRKKVDPSKMRDDPCKKKEDPSKKKEDPSKKKEDPSKKKDDPSKKKEDPSKKKDDPSKKKVDPSKKKEDPCKKKEDSSKKKEDPCKKKEDPCKKKEDPCKKKEDPCKQKEDPCKQKEDPCKKKEDPCKKKEDPCKQKEDPCKQKEDPCKKKESLGKKVDSKKKGPTYPLIKNPCLEKSFSKKGKKDDPCKKTSVKKDICEKDTPKKDPCKKEEKKKDPCKKKGDGEDCRTITVKKIPPSCNESGNKKSATSNPCQINEEIRLPSKKADPDACKIEEPKNYPCQIAVSYPCKIEEPKNYPCKIGVSYPCKIDEPKIDQCKMADSDACKIEEPKNDPCKMADSVACKIEEPKNDPCKMADSVACKIEEPKNDPCKMADSVACKIEEPKNDPCKIADSDACKIDAPMQNPSKMCDTDPFKIDEPKKEPCKLADFVPCKIDEQIPNLSRISDSDPFKIEEKNKTPLKGADSFPWKNYKPIACRFHPCEMADSEPFKIEKPRKDPYIMSDFPFKIEEPRKDQCKMADSQPRKIDESTMDPSEMDGSDPRKIGELIAKPREIADSDPSKNNESMTDPCKIADSDPSKNKEWITDPCKIADSDPSKRKELMTDPCKIADSDPSKNKEWMTDPCKIADSDPSKNKEWMKDLCKIADSDPSKRKELMTNACKIADSDPSKNKEWMTNPCKIADSDPSKRKELMTNPRKIADADPCRTDVQENDSCTNSPGIVNPKNNEVSTHTFHDCKIIAHERDFFSSFDEHSRFSEGSRPEKTNNLLPTSTEGFPQILKDLRSESQEKALLPTNGGFKFPQSFQDCWPEEPEISVSQTTGGFPQDFEASPKSPNIGGLLSQPFQDYKPEEPESLLHPTFGGLQESLNNSRPDDDLDVIVIKTPKLCTSEENSTRSFLGLNDLGAFRTPTKDPFYNPPGHHLNMDVENIELSPKRAEPIGLSGRIEMPSLASVAHATTLSRRSEVTSGQTLDMSRTTALFNQNQTRDFSYQADLTSEEMRVIYEQNAIVKANMDSSLQSHLNSVLTTLTRLVVRDKKQKTIERPEVANIEKEGDASKHVENIKSVQANNVNGDDCPSKVGVRSCECEGCQTHTPVFSMVTLDHH